jgi:hypothetical protein
MADKFLFEVTSYYQGQTYTNKVFAATKEIAIAEITKDWVKGVEILKVEQLSFTPAKTGTPNIR